MFVPESPPQDLPPPPTDDQDIMPRSHSKARQKSQPTAAAAATAEPSQSSTSAVIWCCSQTATLYGEDIQPNYSRGRRELKNPTVVFFIWLIFGLFGGHHFYLGRPVNGALWCCSLGGCGLGWLYDLTRLRNLIADANVGVSKHQEYETTCFYCCRNFCGSVLLLLFCAAVTITQGPYYIRKFDPMNCGFVGNPYDVLGVPFGTSFNQCRKAYRTLAKELHPDHNPGCDQACTDKMADVNLAFEKLKSRDSSTVVDDDLGEQWSDIFECFSSGERGEHDGRATRERQPFHSSSSSSSGGGGGGGGSCNDVCPVGVCDSPSDSYKDECQVCAECMSGGRTKKKKNMDKNKNKKKTKKEKEKKKKKERKKHEEQTKKKNKRAVKRKRKQQQQQMEKQEMNQRKREKKTDDSSPTELSGAQQWFLMSTQQRYDALSERVTAQWMQGVMKVLDSQQSVSDVERFGVNKEATASYFMWVYVLKQVGIEELMLRKNLGKHLVESGVDVPSFFDCDVGSKTFLACTVIFEAIAEVVDAGDEGDERDESTIKLMKGLTNYQIVLRALSDLDMIPVKALEGYGSRVTYVLSLDTTSEVRKMSKMTLDLLGVKSSVHQRALRSAVSGLSEESIHFNLEL